MLGSTCRVLLRVVGAVARGRGDCRRRPRPRGPAYRPDRLPVPLAQIAQIVIVGIFGIIAAAEIAISTEVLLVLIGVLLAAVSGTFTLAFGLGSRDIAHALSAGRYLRHDYRLGHEIGFGDVRGRISRIDSTSTMLDAGRRPLDTRAESPPARARRRAS